MESISVADIRKILEALGEESILYCHIRSANFEVVLSADGEGLSLQQSSFAPGAPVAAPAPHVAPSFPAQSQAPVVTPSVAPPAPAAVDANSTAVTAPMPGTFYRAADPASAPFVEIGSHVTADSTVGLIEAMKVFSAVRAGVEGTVVAIDAENDSFVEFGATLVRISVAQ